MVGESTNGVGEGGRSVHPGDSEAHIILSNGKATQTFFIDDKPDFVNRKSPKNTSNLPREIYRPI